MYNYKTSTNKRSLTLAAKNSNGEGVDLEADPYSKRLKVETDLLITPFREQTTNSITPIINGLFIYDVLNTQKFSTIFNNGTATVQDSVCSLNIPTGVGDYALLRSNENLHYFPGTSSICRFSVIFNEAVALSLQRVGLGTASSEFSIGYNGTRFCVYRGYGGKQQEVYFQITMAEATPGSCDVVLNGVTYTINLTNAGGNVNFTALETCNRLKALPTFNVLWNCYSVDDTIVFTAIGVGPRNGSYSITSTSVAATITTKTVGTPLQDVYVYEEDFDRKDILQTLDLTKGNVFQIRFSWLGFSDIEFFVLDPLRHRMELFHRMKITNTLTEPSIYIPHLPFQSFIASAGSATAMSLKLASFAMFTEAVIPPAFFPRFARQNTKNINNSTETVLLAIAVRYSHNGLVNQSRIFIDRLTLATESSKTTVFRIYKNPATLGADTTSDYPNWQYIDLNDSATLIDTNANTFTGGEQIDETLLSPGTSGEKNYSRGELVLNRGEVLIVTGLFGTGTQSELSASLTWTYDY